MPPYISISMHYAICNAEKDERVSVRISSRLVGAQHISVGRFYESRQGMIKAGLIMNKILGHCV